MKQVPLTSGLSATVDDEDYSMISSFRWFAIRGNKANHRERFYAAARISGRTIFMHRFILGPECKGKIVDHADLNTLDNRRSNLRACTPAQNRQNSRKRSNSTARFKGLSKQGNGWCVRIRQHYLGRFTDQIEAAKVYNSAALAEFGRFARLNEIPT